MNSKRKPNSIETDRGKEVYTSNFQKLLNIISFKLYSRKSSYGAVFVEHFKPTIRHLLKPAVFERSDADWVDILTTTTKQTN